MRRILWMLALAGLLWLPGCGSDSKDVAEELNIDRSGFTAYFDLTARVLPFPSNLLFSGSTDGTLNIPVANPSDFSNPQVALNALDGFSTVAPMSTRFSSAIDPATLTSSTVRVFEVNLTGIGGAVTGINRELVFGSEFLPTISSVDPSNATLVILPTRPLKPRTSYLVMLSDGIKGATGRDPQTSAHYLIAKTPSSLAGSPAAALEPVRQLVNAQETALAAQGINKDQIILSWTFTTQSIGNVLSATRTITSGTAVVAAPLGTTANLLPPGASPGVANVFAGSLTLPYYLNNAGVGPTAPLNTFWSGAGGSNLTFLNPTPVAKSTETIPMLVSLPNAGSGQTKPLTGWKVAIFQHGITSNRTSMLALADTMARAGFALVAIDLPLHGLAPGHPLRLSAERTFDLDLVNNSTGAPGPDGLADRSGTHFINLASLLTSRDNLRQAVADLFALTSALPTLDVDGGGADFDPNQIYFVGHSLGGMVGSVFLALEPTVKSAVLGMPGGGIAKLLDGSAAFGPQIAAGLAAKGVVKGTAEYESFLGATQTVIDSGDPINYATATVANRGLMLLEVVGDGAGSLPDQVVPNNVLANAPAGTVPSPLAGTDPLASLMGLTRLTATTVGLNQKAWLRFTSGDHASLLSPVASLAATTVMQEATATFLASDGSLVAISNPPSGPVVASAGLP